MKSRLRPYTEFLLRQNLPYLVVAIILIMVTAGLSIYLNDRIKSLDARITVARQDVQKLNAKHASLNSVTGESSQNLDQDLEIMSALIPDSEDYFSIITALETLSQRTGFRIGTYAINLLASTSNRLSLTVIGNGDSETFLNFLKNYQLGGGRLITAESIGLEPQETGSIRLELNFYNKKVSSEVASSSAAIAPSLAELNDIKSKVTFTLTDPQSSDPRLQDYPTKSDPF